MPYERVLDSLQKGIGGEGLLSLLVLCSDRDMLPLLDLVLRCRPAVLGEDERYRRAPRKPSRYPDLIAAGLEAMASDLRAGWLGGSPDGHEGMVRHFARAFQLPIEGTSVEAMERLVLDHLAVRDVKDVARALDRPEWAGRTDHAEYLLRVALLRRGKRTRLGLPWPPVRRAEPLDGPDTNESGWFRAFRDGAFSTLDDLLNAVPGGEAMGFARPPRCNVFVAGRSGAGKTTLIHAMFGLPPETYGEARPMTAQATWYEHPTRPLRLCDTRGLERGRFPETIDALRRALSELRTTPDPAIQPHVAWLCIDGTGAKIEPGEQQLAELLTEFDIPVICVLTKSWFGDDLLSHVSRLLPNAKACVRVLAEGKRFSSGVEVDPYGLEELVTATLEQLPDGVRQGFAAVQTVILEPKVTAARLVINTATGLAAAAAAVPIPFSDAVALAPIQVGMIIGISRAVGMDLKEAAKPLVAAALGVAVATFGGRMIAAGLANLAKLVPGIGSVIGASINGTIAASVTRTLGEAYLEFLTGHFRKSGRLPTAEEAIAYFQTWWNAQRAADRVE